MGYSVCIRFKNAKEQQKMYDFYTANTDIITALAKAEGRDYDVDNFTDLHWDDRLSYAPKVKYLLGFDGGSGRPYYFELLMAWMAVKSSFKDKDGQSFMYYDREKIKVQQPNNFMLQVNEDGIQTVATSLAMKEQYRMLSFNLYTLEDVLDPKSTPEKFHNKFENYAKEVETLFKTLEERWQAFEHAPQTKKIKP